jgi:hypothetical protein
MNNLLNKKMLQEMTIFFASRRIVGLGKWQEMLNFLRCSQIENSLTKTTFSSAFDINGNHIFFKFSIIDIDSLFSSTPQRSLNFLELTFSFPHQRSFSWFFNPKSY